MEFSKDCVNKVVESYCPIVSKHKDDKFTPEQKQWQQVSSSPGEPLGNNGMIYSTNSHSHLSYSSPSSHTRDRT